MDLQEALNVLTKDNPSLRIKVQDILDRSQLIRWLIALRANSGLSQEEVAQRMDCSQSHISKLEHGFDSDISADEVVGYLKAVGVWSGIVNGQLD